MSDFSVSIPHRLSQEDALRRVQQATAHFAKQHSDKTDVVESWKENTGTFVVSSKGQQIPATIVVNSAEVIVEGTLSWLARPFKSRIEGTIKEVLERILA